MADLQQLETWCEDLLRKLEPAARRRLTLEVARQLRTANATRMKAQTDPDGNAWQRRKPQGDKLRSQARADALRKKSKRPMFEKLRRPRWLKAKGNGSSAVVEFAGKAARIAAVHHNGETDEVKPGGPTYQYPARPLLGISQADADLIRAELDMLKREFRRIATE